MSNVLLTGTLPYVGTKADSPPNLWYRNRRPQDGGIDIDYSVGDLWLYTDPSPGSNVQELYFLASLKGNSASLGRPLAKWNLVSSGSVGDISSILTDTGVVVPDISGQVSLLAGENTNTQVGGTPSTVLVNLNRTIHWPSTNAAGDEGVIYLDAFAGVGGDRFLHNYGDGGGSDNNTFLGIDAGNFTMGVDARNNIGIGTRSLAQNVSGASNTAVGVNTLFELTSGEDNIAIGRDALSELTSGSNNIAIGSEAIKTATISSDNIGIGFGALDVDTLGAGNIAIGTNALGSNTGGSNNIAIGQNALVSSAGGANSIAIGINALTDETSGLQNTGIGGEALFAITTGTNNTAVGFQAGNALTTSDSNNVCIGNIGIPGSNDTNWIGEEGLNPGKTYITQIYNIQLNDVAHPAHHGFVLAANDENQIGEVALESSDGSVNIDTISNPGIIDFTVSGGGGGSTNPISFSAIQVTDTGNQVDGSEYAMGSGVILTEIFDVTNNFYPGDGTGGAATFTAPVTGKYYMEFYVFTTTTAALSVISIVVSGDVSTARTYKLDGSLAGSGAGTFHIYSTVAAMTIGDVATFTITGTSGGTNDWKVLGDGGDNLTQHVYQASS
jgi:hypothetical protein